MKTLLCVVIGVADGVSTVQVDAADSVLAIKINLLAQTRDLSSFQPEDLTLYRATVADEHCTRWLTVDDSLVSRLSCEMLPPQVESMLAAHSLPDEAVVEDVWSNVPNDSESVIHALVTLPSPRHDRRRVERWAAINTIMERYESWPADPPDEEPSDDEDHKPSNASDQADALMNELKPVVCPQIRRYTEPALSLLSEEIQTLTTVLWWAKRTNTLYEGTHELWTALVPPIVWCVANRHHEFFILPDLHLISDHIPIRNLCVPYLLSNDDKRVAVVQVKKRDWYTATVKALVVCEILTASYGHCRWRGAVVTDGLEWHSYVASVAA